MEKLKTTKRPKNEISINKKTNNAYDNNSLCNIDENPIKEKSKTNSKLAKKKNNKNGKRLENNQKTRKIVQFFNKNKQNLKDFSFLSLIFAVTISLTFVVFFNSEYYQFLNRPQIISSPLFIILLFVLMATSKLVYSVLEILNKLKLKVEQSKKKASTQSENISNVNKKSLLSDNIPKQKKVVDISKKNKLFDALKKVFIFKNNFLINYLSYIFILCALLCFNLKILWLCVVFLFFVCFDSFVTIVKSSKSKIYQKCLSIGIFILAFCLLLSFYMLFMLN